MPEARQVLLVDDSTVLRRIAAATISGFGGYAVEEAPDGYEALVLMAEKDFDLVLLDYYLPGLDGIEVVRRLRKSEDGHRASVVMVTSERDPYIETEAKAAGVDDFILKPMDPIHLRKVMSRLTARTSGEPAPLKLDVQSVLDSMPYPVMVLDGAHNVLIGNEAFWCGTGAGIGDQGVRCATAMHPDGQVPPNCPLVTAARDGRAVEDRVRDGEHDLLVSVYPLPAADETGEPLFLHIARPIG